MAKKLTLSIGGELVEISKRDYLNNQEFKKQLQAAAATVMPYITGMSTAPTIDLQNPESFTAFLTQMFGAIDGLLGTALDLIMKYARNLPANTAEVMHDDEIIDNFLVILNAAIPLGKLKSLSAGFSSIG